MWVWGRSKAHRDDGGLTVGLGAHYRVYLYPAAWVFLGTLRPSGWRLPVTGEGRRGYRQWGLPLGGVSSRASRKGCLSGSPPIPRSGPGRPRPALALWERPASPRPSSRGRAFLRAPAHWPSWVLGVSQKTPPPPARGLLISHPSEWGGQDRAPPSRGCWKGTLKCSALRAGAGWGTVPCPHMSTPVMPEGSSELTAQVPVPTVPSQGHTHHSSLSPTL